MTIVDLPATALANAFVAKEKFYQAGDIKHGLKQLFIDEIEKITLHAVIAPRTMNIACDDYGEMHIFKIELKGTDISPKVLEAIDSAIPRPVLFIVIRPNEQVKYWISYKELKAHNSDKSKVIQHYSTAWGADPLRLMGNSVKNIYVNFIRQIEPTFDPSKPITEAVHDTKQRQQIQRQIESINKKIANEPSVAKKQQLARQRHQLEQEI